MAKNVLANICWSVSEIGSKALSSITAIRSIAVFEEINVDEAWSVEIELLTRLNGELCFQCNLSIIFDENAPNEIFTSGTKFSLYGSEKVATGIIL
ncbi:hypothetical protein C8Z91_23110 [Paenibacillus elgii]|uniref:Uncharacterized protein n=1 Tax=Paenibacillus elgii TaxID=189691 RepID=A0A2T6FYC4_9BACL|nr:hypothetical protein [Paenibacillus elgii]PUA36898.1 hypothetical protein C8Z91_23110 [Paenibacillus elgii]